MKQSNQETKNSDNASRKVRIVAQRPNLQKLFEQHGNQFCKWNLLPFLHHKERASLRSSSTVFKRFIPAPKFVYFNTKNSIFVGTKAKARLEKITGSVETRGSPTKGGDSESVAAELQSDVIEIFSTNSAFLALKNNGKIVTWGNPQCGGNISSVSSEIHRGVVRIVCTRAAFAVLTQVGKVISWGYPTLGGDSSSIGEDLQSDVTDVVGTMWAFAALRSNGKVVSWGDPECGGNSSHLLALNHGVVKIESIRNGNGFRATKNDGNVIEWP